MVGAQSTHIPLKLAMAGVMPVIFASSFMTFPAMIIQIFVQDIANQTGFLAGLYKFSIATSTSNVEIGYSIANALVYLLLIIGFTFSILMLHLIQQKYQIILRKMVDSFLE